MINKLLGWVITFTATGLGIASFLYPFFKRTTEPQPLADMRTSETPLLFTLLLGLCVLVLLFEVQSQSIDTKLISLLGMLVAINSVLRFIEVSIPGPGGFTPIFFLIILVGYTFGGRLGFVMGALTMFVSAIITGGVGPWLPSQMFVAGWVGMSSVIVRIPVNLFRFKDKFNEVAILAVFGLVWGFLYGAIMNLWSWPYMTGVSDQYWVAGIGLAATLQRYALYYLATSLVWDASGALGNLFLILIAGSATLKSLRRFQQRFSFTYTALKPTAGISHQ